MKNIAFKRASSNPSTAPFYHPLTIIQHWEVSVDQEQNYVAGSNFEILPEDQFLKELAKNESLHEEFLKSIEAQKLAVKNALEAESVIHEQEHRKLEEEFKQFQKWKKKSKR
jgi:hypothetical protein